MCDSRDRGSYVTELRVRCACGCGLDIPVIDRWGKVRRFINGHSQRGKAFSPEHRAGISAAARQRKGRANPHWRGGRYIDQDGYVLVYAPNHPHQCGRNYVYEHILVWEALGGPLPDGYGIHHRNGDKQDNRFENLEAMSRPAHATLHNGLRKIERVALKKDECVVVEIAEILAGGKA